MEIFPRCRAEFDAPCSINWAVWIVRDVVEALQDSSTFPDEVLDNVTLGVYNREFNFWPEIVDLETGLFVASGAPSSVEPRIGRTVSSVFEAESLTSQKGLWRDLRAMGDKRFFRFVGYDNYHSLDDGSLESVERSGYWSLVENTSFAVMAAYTLESSNDLAQNCHSWKSQLCSTNYAAQTVGDALSTLLLATDDDDLRTAFHNVAKGRYNRRGANLIGELACEGGYESGCFFPVIVDSRGIVVTHGLVQYGDASELVGESILDPPHSIATMKSLTEAAQQGGAFRFFEHNELESRYSMDDRNLSVGFVAGVAVANETYYVFSSFRHLRDDARLGPYCGACSAFENYPCGWNNARTLLGFQNAMLLASTIDNETSFDEAWNLLTYSDTYSISTQAYRDFYAFAYDFNGTCVAHGRRPEFVGRNVTFNVDYLVGDTGVDGWDLHVRWMAASQTDGNSAVRYPWVNDEGNIFDKVAYVVQVSRLGHEYYVAVGIGEVQPEIPTFSEAQHGYLSAGYRSFDDELVAHTALGLATFYLATAENVEDYAEAIANVSAISYPARSELVAQNFSEDLDLWWDNSTNPYVVGVWAETADEIVVYNPDPSYVGKSLVELSTFIGVEQLSFDDYVSGDWHTETVRFRVNIRANVDSYFIFYETIDIADEIYDGLTDGIGERLHMFVLVRDRPAPTSADSFFLDGSGCASIGASINEDETLIPGNQCACASPSYIEWIDVSREDAQIDSTLDYSCFADKGAASKIVDLYRMECDVPIECDPGYYYVVGNSPPCTACPAGRYRLDTDPFECIECEAGRAESQPGSVRCMDCGRLEYQDELGQEFCKTCPMHTERYITTTIQPLGTSKEDCMCQLGSCDDPPCKFPYLVEEILLSNNQTLDYTEDDDSFSWPRPETGAYVTGFREETGVDCEACPEGAICVGGTNPPFPKTGYNGKKWGVVEGIGEDAVIVGDHSREELMSDWHDKTKFEQCDGPKRGEDWCKSNFRCHKKRRRQNRLMCWAIEKGRVSLFGEQWACPKGQLARWFLTIFLFVAAIATFLFLNVSMGSFTAMDIFLNNTRSMSIIKDFNLSWPLDRKWLFSLQLWFTFLDISQIDVEVVEPTCLFNQSFEGQLATQISLFVFEALLYFFPALYEIGFRKDQPVQVESLISNAISRTTSMTTMMYPTLAVVGLRGFSCREFADGHSYLIADLDVRCWDTNEHKRILVTCSFITAIVVAYPVVVLLQLRYLHQRNKLHDRVALERFGLFYEGYKLENYQWGVFQIAKALVLSFIQVIFQTRPTLQVFVALNFLIFCVAAQFYYNPFLHRKSDQLEAFFLFATCVMLGIGSTFNALDSENTDNSVEDALYALLHLLLFTCVGVSLRAVYVDICERRLTAESRAKLLELVNIARRKECESAADDDEHALREYKPAEIHDTLKPFPLAKWVRSFSERSVLNGISDERQDILRDVGEIDEWFSPALSDVGIASVFSNTEEAIFWRRIDLALPDLFEFLATANTETVVNLKVILGRLLASEVHVAPRDRRDNRRNARETKRVGYRDFIAKEDRGALLRGLILADEKHRRQFYRILDALARSNNMGAQPDDENLKGSVRRVPLGYEPFAQNATRAIRMTSIAHRSDSELSLSAVVSRQSSLENGVATAAAAATSDGREERCSAMSSRSVISSATSSVNDESTVEVEDLRPSTTNSYAKQLYSSLEILGSILEPVAEQSERTTKEEDQKRSSSPPPQHLFPSSSSSSSPPETNIDNLEP